jgi:hypothetical protein
MDYHIGNPIELFPYQEPSSCGEVVRILNRHLGVYFEMKFNVVLKPSLSGISFLHARYPRYAECNSPDVFNPFIAGALRP